MNASSSANFSTPCLGQRATQVGLGALLVAVVALVTPDASRATSMPGKAAACQLQPLPHGQLQAELALPSDEQLAQAWRCQDADGEHLVTVSWVRQPGQRAAQLLFTQRTKLALTWKKGWQARDFVMGPADGHLATTVTAPRVVLRDADGDGRIEAYLGYILPGPTQAVDEGKLLVFFNARKFAIRGAIPRSAEDFGSRQIGTAFHDLPVPVQQQALGLWDALSHPQPLQPARLPRKGG